MIIKRQGDTLYILTDIEHVPSNEIKTDIVVKGSTGHNHIVENGIFYPQSSPRHELIIGYLQASQGCNIVHPDHDPLSLSEGIYEVRRQREVWNGGIRVVVD